MDRASVLRWPNRDAVDRAVRLWVVPQIQQRPELIRVGYFGSYARGDWGVGSDVDPLAVVADSTEPFERRAAGWDTMDFPVAVDLFVYTEAEWERLRESATRFARMLATEVVWVFP